MCTRILYIFLCFSIASSLHSQTGGKQFSFLPETKLIKPLSLDPISGKTSGGLFAYWNENELQEIIYASFSFGMERSIFRWDMPNSDQWDIAIELGSFTQFEFILPLSSSIRSLINTDFKIGIPVTLVKGDHYFKANYYHVSSHLGDDYLIRHEIEGYRPKPLQYEQLDLYYLRRKDNLLYYLGAGSLLRSNGARKLFSCFGGFEYVMNIQSINNLAFTIGTHLRLNAETDFKMNLNSGLGIIIGDLQNNSIKILAQYYTGMSPYSAFEYNKVSFLGLSAIFNPI